MVVSLIYFACVFSRLFALSILLVFFSISSITVTKHVFGSFEFFTHL
jgi:hypothetical protein